MCPNRDKKVNRLGKHNSKSDLLSTSLTTLRGPLSDTFACDGEGYGLRAGTWEVFEWGIFYVHIQIELPTC